MWRLIRLGPAGRQAWAGKTFAAWLASIGQPPGVVRRFWDVVITSACNIGVDRVGAGHAIQVFRQGFLENRWSYTMGLSAVPLVSLYDAARDVLADRGGEVRLGASARALAFDGRRVTGVVLADGRVDAAAVVSAVPFDRLDRLVSDTMRQADARLQSLDRLDVSPILGMHLWFEQPVMSVPHLVLVDHDVQWLFNKGTDLDGRQHVHAVISAADDWMTLDEPAIVQRVTNDLYKALPGAAGLPVAQARCIKEKRATFAATPQAEAWRPAAAAEHSRGSGIRNLYLEGDWCDTGWPATMEGAVRSGYAAAEVLLADRGVEASLMVEDVPPSWLARVLQGK